MAVLTLSQALDRAKAGQPFAPTRQRIDAQLRASMRMAVNVLARQAAMKAARQQLSAQGLRPSQFSHRELVVRADAYLADHRAELIAKAKLIVARWQAAGMFGNEAAVTSRV
jgi:hypothetical protein